ncbi:MAG TPA: sugar ABC transporter ATP-binding protein [Verrucomicrobiae bacterium]|jgi:simple sugar transport system ATP-binding protein|nr:sugar ABC transporter ATP-binding protein [Verrucomicrobiae bacterium]
MGDLLCASQISKAFPGVKALQSVDFSLQSGEVHALMGENGAGKSTLIKVLTGVYSPDAGSIRLEGREMALGSAREAQDAGISTVYQEVNLIPHLSVAENICLGREPLRAGFLRWRAIREKAKKALERLGLKIDVSRPLSSFSIAIQQLVAIARAVDCAAKVLILDEPTSSLDRGEVEQLFRIINQLKREGLGIVFVTHFLDQVYAVSDRITVLRNGQLVGTYLAAELPRLELISKMIGRDASALEQAREKENENETGQPFLHAAQLGRKNSVEGLTFSLAPGEVLGLAGLLGSGRTETARLLFGIDQPTSGSLRIDGEEKPRLTARRAVGFRFGYCSEDRKTEGIIPNLTIRENIVLALQARLGAFRPVRRQTQLELAERFIQALRIATPDAEKPIKSLSGGNQQKVLLARWLAAEPRFLILDEPTRGIDVGAKFEILNLVRDLVRKGMAILFISSELEEVVRTCSRVLVLRDRKQISELDANQISGPTIMRKIAQKDSPFDER